MDKYLIRSASTSSLNSNKRDREDHEGWQAAKRPATQRKLTSNAPSVPTSNRFSSLNVDYTSQLSEPLRTAILARKNPKRIPPIIIQMQDNWTHVTIKTLIEKFDKNFHLQYRGSNRVSIQCYCSVSHQSIKEGLQGEKVSFHTFTRKDERVSKVVIKGLPAYFEDTLAEELKEIGFEALIVTKLCSPSKEPPPCPPFLVQLPAGSDISKFRQIKYIGNCAVEICRYKANTSIGTQCYRCQNFGHASRNCNLPTRCVKCAGDHASKDCPKKDRETPARCCNCLEDHAASYSKCPERQKYVTRLKEKTANRKAEPPTSQKTKTIPDRPAPVTIRRNWPTVAPLRLNDQPALFSEKAASKKPLLEDKTTIEMLEILAIIKTIRGQFIECKTMLDKVVMILTHLGQYI